MFYLVRHEEKSSESIYVASRSCSRAIIVGIRIEISSLPHPPQQELAPVAHSGSILTKIPCIGCLPFLFHFLTSPRVFPVLTLQRESSYLHHYLKLCFWGNPPKDSKIISVMVYTEIRASSKAVTMECVVGRIPPCNSSLVYTCPGIHTPPRYAITHLPWCYCEGLLQK